MSTQCDHHGATDPNRKPQTQHLSIEENTSNFNKDQFLLELPSQLVLLMISKHHRMIVLQIF